MGGNTSISTVDLVSEAMSSAVTSTIMTVTHSVDVDQSVLVDCDKISENQLAAFNTCLDKPEYDSILKEGKLTTEGVLQICGALIEKDGPFRCYAQNVSIGSVINLDLTSEQVSDVTNTIETNIDSSIRSSLNQQVTDLTIGDTLSSDISSVSKAATTVMSSTISSLVARAKTDQSIIVRGGSINFVAVTSVVDIVSDELQKDSKTQTAVTKLVSSIDSAVSQATGEIGGIASTVIGVFFAVIVAIVMTLWILKKMRKTVTITQPTT
jgi:hypothetical protein